MKRVLGRRVAQLTLAGAVAATPLVLGGGVAQATDWDAVAQCESGGNWSTNTGNGFSGGLQFTPSTWKAFGGKGSPQGASREHQIEVAEKVKAAQGMNAWPTCSKKTGQTSNASNGSKATAKKSSASESSSGSSSASSSKAKGSTTPTAQPKQKPASSSVAPAGTYTVKSGDTLSGIASAHGVSGGAADIASRNGIADPDVIAVGQQLALR
jgi:LysM repeat protein